MKEPNTFESERKLDEYSSPYDRIEQLERMLSAMTENRDYWYNIYIDSLKSQEITK